MPELYWQLRSITETLQNQPLGIKMSLIDQLPPRIAMRLRETFSNDEASILWLTQRHPYLGKTPMQAVINGEAYRVLDAIEALDSGIFI